MMANFIVLFMILSGCLTIYDSLNAAFKDTDPDGMAKISVEWENGRPSGSIEILSGKLDKITLIKGEGESVDRQFAFFSDGPCRIDITVRGTSVEPGPGATIVRITIKEQGFSFFLRDVSSGFPIIIPAYGVSVLPEGDDRTYGEVLSTIRQRQLRTKLEVIECEAEESFENAARNTRNQPCPTWLGLPRDFRLFEVDFGLGYYNRQRCDAGAALSHIPGSHRSRRTGCKAPSGLPYG
jgi:hypothetical protein